MAHGEQVASQYDANSGPEPAEEIKLDEAAGSPHAFQVGAEHPQRQHIPNDVTKSAMEEKVGSQLPDEEILHHFGRNKSEEAEWPIQTNQLCEEAQQEDGDIADEQPLDALRKSGGVKDAGPGSTAERHEKTARLDSEYQNTGQFSSEILAGELIFAASETAATCKVMASAIQTCQWAKKPLAMRNSSVQPRSELTRHRPRTKATTAAGVSSAGRTFIAASEAMTIRSTNR